MSTITGHSRTRKGKRNEPASETLSHPSALEGIVYLAYPLTVHRTARARRLVRLARRRFPHADVIPACELFTSNADWLSRWPEILPTLAAVCVFTDEDGWVGYGVSIEVNDAQAQGLPIFLLTETTLHPWAAVEV